MNNSEYLVSICVPIYGVEKYIERCVISLFEQTYQNIEYIFINDNTPDRSVDILKSVIEKYPNRKPNIRIIAHEKNRGLAAARNTGVGAATGEFLMHVDSDDWIDKDCVRQCVDKQIETNADIVNFDAIKHCKNYTIPLTHIETKTSFDLTLLTLGRETLFTIWGRMIRLSLYTDNMISVKEGINMGEDYQVIPKIVYNAERIGYLHEFLYHYNCQNESSYCFKFSEEKERQIWATLDILTEYFKNKDACFMDALNKGKIKIYCNSRINACRSNNKKYFLETNKRIGLLNSRYNIYLSIPYQISLKIKNFSLLRIYIKVASFVNCKKNDIFKIRFKILFIRGFKA